MTTSDDGSYSDLFEPPSVGAWKVEARWGGDADFEGATSQVVGFIVRKAPTSLSLQPSAPGVTAGETLTWTFTALHTGSYGDVVTNTAEFSGTLQAGEDDAVFSVVEPHTIFLPLVLRNN